MYDREEADFNVAHKKPDALDRQPVKAVDEMGPIEFCDLLAGIDGRVQIIHVKPESGAALRAWFAQGYDSAQLYKLNDEFRSKVRAGRLQKDKGAEIGAGEKKILAEFSKLIEACPRRSRRRNQRGRQG